MGPLGALRAARGRSPSPPSASRSSPCSPGLGTQLNAERGAAEELPRQRAPRSPAARCSPTPASAPGVHEAARRARRERRRPAADRRDAAHRARHRRRRRAPATGSAGPTLARRGVPGHRRRRRPASRRSSTAPTPRSRARTARSPASPRSTATSCTPCSAASPTCSAFVLILTLILLTRAFRSIVLALKAVLLNLVSLARGVRDRGRSSSSRATARRSGTSRRPSRSPPRSR